MTNTGPENIFTALVEEGVLSEKQFSQAVAEQKASGRPLSEILIQQGAVGGAALVRILARRLGVRGCRLRHGLVDRSLLELIGQAEAEQLKAIPMTKVHGVLTVAMAEPCSLPKIDRLRRLTGCKIRPVLALEENILEFIKKYAEHDLDIDSFLTSLADPDVRVVERETVDEGPMTDLDRMVEGSPIVNLVNMALLTAIKDGASDIHIEPDESGTIIRYRIDGRLRELMRPPTGLHAAIVSRVKVIGKMDIAEKRLPQEGRVHIIAEGRGIDLRVSTIPTLLGEKLVIRVLDKANLHVRLEELGFRAEVLAVFRRMLRQPHGLVLVTGPTGSGKTTTLYSALYLIRSPELNIVTVEDPVEYQLKMIHQIQAHDSIGLSFARALRSILRQDPDVVMIGEIRDEETARIAVQAALTGHLVLATLHTNDAPGAVARLLDMNVAPYLLSGVLNGVVAQRLARTICPNCATSYYPPENVLADTGMDDKIGRPFRKGTGCPKCHDSGFKGRTGIYELMEVTAGVRRMIHGAAPSHEIRAYLRDGGVLALREEGMLLALEGRTTPEEILRITRTADHEQESQEGGQTVAEPQRELEHDSADVRPERCGREDHETDSESNLVADRA